MRYIFPTKVTRIEERSRTAHAHKSGDEVVTVTEKLGWFVVLENLKDAIGFGPERPEFEVGQLVNLIIEDT